MQLAPGDVLSSFINVEKWKNRKVTYYFRTAQNTSQAQSISIKTTETIAFSVCEWQRVERRDPVDKEILSLRIEYQVIDGFVR